MSKTFDYNADKDHRLYPFCMKVGKFIFDHFYKIQVLGLDNIPKDGGFILAANHMNALDPAFITTHCPRPVHYMGKASLFENPFTRWFLTNMNGFPIRREGLDTKGIGYAEKLLEKGHVLGIFPEGTRSKTLTPGKAKAGVAMIAKATHANVVPVALYYSEKPHFRSRITIRVGEVIPFDALGLTDEERNTQQLRSASALVMERIVELWKRKHEA